MKSSYETIIRCPLGKVFLTVADLVRWPEFLPHYRYNRFVKKTPSGGVVRMSCYRFGFPLKWVSEYRIDLVRRRLSFKHIKGALNATQGMDILWQFHEIDEHSTRVKVMYDFTPSARLGGPFLARLVLGEVFIHTLAEQTLAGLKHKMEALLLPAEVVDFPPAPRQPQTLVRGRRIRRRISSRPRVAL